MNKIIAVVAVGPNGLIGIDNNIPWNVKEDLHRFKQLTLNHTVIMGRNTWESLNKTCLSNRINYVISKQGNLSLVSDTTAVCFSEIDYAIAESNLKYPNNNIFIIGGGSIYNQTLPIWDELYLTIINKDQINYVDGRRVYFLNEYPNFIRQFNEVDSITTEYATYKKYTRKTTSSIIKNQLF
jgi:dihydrofolate reductase